jgi:DNA-binding MarR family transcriptional regulator
VGRRTASKRAARLDPAVVADRLHSAAIHLLRRVQRVDEASGLGPAKLSALSVVVFRGPLSLGELAAAEQVRPPTMTRIVDGLQELGLVRKESPSEDRRRIRISATQLGRKVLDDARRRRIGLLVERLRELPDEDVALLERAAELMEQASTREEA